jgi:hypothetical protein
MTVAHDIDSAKPPLAAGVFSCHNPCMALFSSGEFGKRDGGGEKSLGSAALLMPCEDSPLNQPLCLPPFNWVLFVAASAIHPMGHLLDESMGLALVSVSITFIIITSMPPMLIIRCTEPGRRLVLFNISFPIRLTILPRELTPWNLPIHHQFFSRIMVEH